MLWDPGVRYPVCEAHSHTSKTGPGLCVTGGVVLHDYVSVPFYLLQCEVSGAV